MKLVSRDEARGLGLKRYFTGKPCKHGHVAERQANNGTCLVCRAEILIRFHECHPEQQSRYSAESRKNYPERAKKHARNTYEKHKAKRLEHNREYRAANRAQLNSQKKEYVAKNPELIRVIKQKYRARRRGAEGQHSAADIQKIFKVQKGRCACCRIKFKRSNFHIDHIVPLVRGGSNWPSNIQLLCAVCNIKKGPKDSAEFMRHEMGRLL